MYKILGALIKRGWAACIRFPSGNYALQCALEFKRLTGGIPNIVAAIDGSHFSI